MLMKHPKTNEFTNYITKTILKSLKKQVLYKQKTYYFTGKSEKALGNLPLKYTGTQIISYLEERKCFAQSSSDDFTFKQGDRLYIGFDPTAEKLHLGNLVGIINALRCAAFGIEPVFLIGGATGLIGDPSGKSKERPQMSKETAANNSDKLANSISRMVRLISESSQYQKFVSTLHPNEGQELKYLIVNNKDFYNDITIINFLREIGSNLRMGQLLSREVVRNRMNSEEGFSLTEFLYQSFQAYDYFKLYKDYNVKMQLGGSDQWGNMLAGLELINKQVNKSNSETQNSKQTKEKPKNKSNESKKETSLVINITHPLITTKCGKKLGKSEGNAINLCSENPNDMYEYIFNMPDINIEPLFYQFTFLSSEEIREVMEKHLKNPELRFGQKMLAETILTKYCDENKINGCKYNNQNLNNNDINDEFILKNNKIEVSKESYEGVSLSNFCYEQNIIPNKTQLKNLFESKSVKLNNKLITEDKIIDTNKDLYKGQYLLIQTGKTNKHLFHFSSKATEKLY